MSQALAHVAAQLDLHERTLRRWLDESLIHGRRGHRGWEALDDREVGYLASHGATLTRLRAALRHEPSVRLAVLYGSRGRGDATAGSDIDLLIELDQPSLSARLKLTERLSRRLGEPIDLVMLEDVERTPSLMAAVLSEGRPVKGGKDRWPATQRRNRQAAERAASEIDQARSEVLAYFGSLDAKR